MATLHPAATESQRARAGSTCSACQAPDVGACTNVREVARGVAVQPSATEKSRRRAGDNRLQSRKHANTAGVQSSAHTLARVSSNRHQRREYG
jgi:hypothetical protein